MEAPVNRMMIDFETLDVEASAVVLSVGCIVFNEEGIVDSMYTEFHLGGQIAEGRTVSLETQLWWMEQNPEEFLRLCTRGSVKLEDFCEAFMAMMNEYNVREVWSRGSMDFLILNDILDKPVPYYMARDVRTLDSLGVAKMRKNAHNAYQDADNQVAYVREILCQIKSISAPAAGQA